MCDWDMKSNWDLWCSAETHSVQLQLCKTETWLVVHDWFVVRKWEIVSNGHKTVTKLPTTWPLRNPLHLSEFEEADSHLSWSLLSCCWIAVKGGGRCINTEDPVKDLVEREKWGWRTALCPCCGHAHRDQEGETRRKLLDVRMKKDG